VANYWLQQNKARSGHALMRPSINNRGMPA
jgi:hypothetical protein